MSNTAPAASRGSSASDRAEEAAEGREVPVGLRSAAPVHMTDRRSRKQSSHSPETLQRRVRMLQQRSADPTSVLDAHRESGIASASMESDHTTEPDRDRDHRRTSTSAGAGVAIGAGVGAALFAATSSPVWMAVGAAGAAVGTAMGARRD
jgi:thiamine pyrophosphate-dependent acetolactate synthase large subunit-like protein